MMDFSTSATSLPLEVTVDDREPHGLFLEFEKRGNLILTKKRLFVGDILFDNELLVERKTVLDFCQSLKDGRLFDQLIKMSNTRTGAVLIIEGNEEEFEKTEVRPEAIQGAIASVSLRFKVPVLRSKDIPQTVDILLQCYRQMDQVNAVPIPKIWRKIKRKGHSFDPVFVQKLKVLASFPGLGFDKSLALIQKFHTLEKLFKTSKEEFLSVKGIGQKTRDEFDRILRD
ncbi:ERCC4 domain-containing protein [Cecembia calidifontis]|uniref:ERCC4-type nuclease n=1 Tax=Cecembia calidifontis TaxID=1187080 RepID=A0A4Q7P9Z5_9BACT|nr:ERCC4 domain-containing protein [Cecembia calidifontis]RZS97001.1 ERCC4-type nuclease [Cecembia calidifontis]